ncbi:MAG: Maltose/maltodextrin import ATP-binding protein MalK [Candidatus Heimdallarchaeota archaeon LC_3]|nr:MAG: Maltose/maltodextrin import ATP-binding protein MalK [Candidatus Heimdallarchaeota archaeon LC_3]
MSKIEIRNVSKNFGRVKALQDVSIDINEGEYIVILGPSGCGKTTLLNIISGVIKPSNGTVLFDNKEVTDLIPSERQLSYVFQNIALFPHKNAWENVSYSPTVRDLPSSEIKKVTETALEETDSLDLKDFYPESLPSGFQQKISISRALARQASIMILDEPISDLDPEVRAKLRYKLRSIVKKLGLTAIHVTHDQEIALTVADRILLMKKGQIVRFVSPQEMYGFPISLFEAFFIGQGNFLEGYVRNQTENELHIRLRREKDIIVRKQLYFPSFENGQAIVVFSRPENTLISKSEIKNSIKGVIKNKSYMGSYYHYEITTVSEDTVIIDVLIIKEPFQISDEVYIRFKQNSTLLFELPRYGLLEELSLE